MTDSSSNLRPLLRFGLVAALFTAGAAFGTSTDDSSRAEVIDRALAALLCGTLPIAVAFAVWGTSAPADAFVALGANRRNGVLRSAASLVVGVPLLTLGFALGVLVWTRGPADPRLGMDALLTMPVAFMAGLSLVLAALAANAWFGRIGLALLALLLLTLGQSELILAAVLPSAHVYHLLGVGAALPFDPGFSMAALWAFSGFGLLAWMARVPP